MANTEVCVIAMAGTGMRGEATAGVGTGGLVKGGKVGGECQLESIKSEG